VGSATRIFHGGFLVSVSYARSKPDQRKKRKGEEGERIDEAGNRVGHDYPERHLLLTHLQ